ncbi:MAG: hypothetical protein ACXW27_00165 [Allosphingosinicella sp.]
MRCEPNQKVSSRFCRKPNGSPKARVRESRHPPIMSAASTSIEKRWRLWQIATVPLDSGDPGAFNIVALNAIPADAVDLFDTLAMIEEHFAALAEAVGAGKFALWVGSGISREKAPDLAVLAADLIEHLRSRLDPADPNDPFRLTLERIMRTLVDMDAGAVAALPLATPFATWPDSVVIAETLRNRYSEMLNLRVPGRERDYLLWEAVDVRAKYGHLADPDIEHLAIAILVLEGAVTEIASGNWDGLIEVAVDRLSPTGRVGILRTVVNPDDIRDGPATATLLKFHGCAVACVADPDAFRPFLVGAERDIIDWPNVDDPLRREVVRMATNLRALVVGLSLQDGNLKDVFSRAKQVHAWHWPVAPEAQPHVFCEDQLGNPQRTVLEVIYGDDFDGNEQEILAAALLRARPRTALPALALHVIADKLGALAKRCTGGLPEAEKSELIGGIGHLRDLVAAGAPADRLQLASFLSQAVGAWSRSMELFRWGEVPAATSQSYSPICPMRKIGMMADQNVARSGLDEAATALALIGRLASSGQASLAVASGPAANGALTVTASYAGATPKHITFVGSSDAVLRLAADGALDDKDTIVVHSSDLYVRTARSSRRSPSGGRPSGARHVSVRQLIDEGLGLVMLEQRFLEEAAL